MKNTKIKNDTKRLERNELHLALICEFGSIYKAVDKLGLNKATLYKWIHNNEVTNKKRVIACGYDPVTFKPL